MPPPACLRRQQNSLSACSGLDFRAEALLNEEPDVLGGAGGSVDASTLHLRPSGDPSRPCGFQELSPQSLWRQGRARSSPRNPPGWHLKGCCWKEGIGIGADYRVFKIHKSVKRAKEMEEVSQTVSMDWDCNYCAQTGEESLFVTVTGGPCSCL